MFIVQQDIVNTSIYGKLKLSGDQRYSTVGKYDNKADAEAHLDCMLNDRGLDNKRCPVRMIEVDDNMPISGLRTNKV